MLGRADSGFEQSQHWLTSAVLLSHSSDASRPGIKRGPRNLRRGALLTASLQPQQTREALSTCRLSAAIPARDQPCARVPVQASSGFSIESFDAALLGRALMHAGWPESDDEQRDKGSDDERGSEEENEEARERRSDAKSEVARRFAACKAFSRAILTVTKRFTIRLG